MPLLWGLFRTGLLLPAAPLYSDSDLTRAPPHQKKPLRHPRQRTLEAKSLLSLKRSPKKTPGMRCTSRSVCRRRLAGWESEVSCCHARYLPLQLCLSRGYRGSDNQSALKVFSPSDERCGGWARSHPPVALHVGASLLISPLSVLYHEKWEMDFYLFIYLLQAHKKKQRKREWKKRKFIGLLVLRLWTAAAGNTNMFLFICASILF